MALPSQIDPRKLALQGTTLEGSFDGKDLTRLSSAVAEVLGPVKATVVFELDESKQPIVSGSASVSVNVVCQRCLDPVAKELKAVFSLQVVWSEDQITNVAPNNEPWVVIDKTAELLPVVEDELLLALPIVNYHDMGDCSGEAFQHYAADKDEKVIADSPFSVLQQLKK
jgi:uncharacterized protein